MDDGYTEDFLEEMQTDSDDMETDEDDYDEDDEGDYDEDEDEDDEDSDSDDSLMEESMGLTEPEPEMVCTKVAPKYRMMYRYVTPDLSNPVDPIGVNFYGPDRSMDMGYIHGTDFGDDSPYVFVEFQTNYADKSDLHEAYALYNEIYFNGRYWRGSIDRELVDITNIYILNRQLYDQLLPIYGDLLTFVQLDEDHNFIHCIYR